MSLSTSKTYNSDIELFHKLGLPAFEVENFKETVVGAYHFPNGSSVKISVICMPAQFWRFEVQTPNEKYMVKTGSGSLKYFWQSVVDIANGMLVVNNL